ncbi:MAG: DUF899 domain-containing protein [Chloroflexota bacterium]|nr:DUF899 domain-containing protein [Chloroflexota bacterium]
MAMITKTQALPPVVSREDWDVARKRLLDQEKALTRLKDAVSAQRRRLPMVEVDAGYTFEGQDGPVTLLDLFDGRPQLILQHFMFGTDWEEGCVGCSMMADHIGPLVHLHARGTSFAMVSRAPIGKLLAYRERMGWDLPWYSSAGTTFNDDFHVTVDGEEQSGISTFLRDGDRVYHTWQTGGRGVEVIINALHYLDLTPYGRQEMWEDSPNGWPQSDPDGWWQRHDRYDVDGRE